VADAGPDQTIDCVCPLGASVTLDGTGSFDLDGDYPLTYQWDVPGVVLDDASSATPNGVFPIGISTATLTVIDARGAQDSDDVAIEVVELYPPEVECTTDVAALWPPNHEMVHVSVYVLATDTVTTPQNLILLSVVVSSDEPDNADGVGDGDTTGDVDGADGSSAPVDVTLNFGGYDPLVEGFVGTIQLRRERDGNGDGRAYTIEATVLNSVGVPESSSCCVIVPHSQRAGPNG
jgi:hypothetical protein